MSERLKARAEVIRRDWKKDEHGALLSKLHGKTHTQSKLQRTLKRTVQGLEATYLGDLDRVLSEPRDIFLFLNTHIYSSIFKEEIKFLDHVGFSEIITYDERSILLPKYWPEQWMGYGYSGEDYRRNERKIKDMMVQECIQIVCQFMKGIPPQLPFVIVTAADIAAEERFKQLLKEKIPLWPEELEEPRIRILETLPKIIDNIFDYLK